MKTIISTIVYLSDRTISIAICERNDLYYISVSCKYKTNSSLNSHHESDTYTIDKFDTVKNIYLNYIRHSLNIQSRN